MDLRKRSDEITRLICHSFQMFGIVNVYVGRDYIDVVSEKKMSEENVPLMNEVFCGTFFGGNGIENTPIFKNDMVYYGILVDFSENFKEVGMWGSICEAYFELIPESELAAFLSGSEDMLKTEDDTLRTCLYEYLNNGVESEGFNLAKLEYFNGYTTTYELLVAIKKILMRKYHLFHQMWYKITILDKPPSDDELLLPAHLLIDEKGTEDPIQVTCGIELLPKELQQRLHDMFLPVPSPERENDTRVSFQPTVVIDLVRVYGVGQAQCIGLFSGLTLEGIFDLGYPDGFNRPKNEDADIAVSTIKELNSIKKSAPRTIFISHWHADHINLIKRLDAGFLNGDVIYAPCQGLAKNTLLVNKYINGKATLRLVKPGEVKFNYPNVFASAINEATSSNNHVHHSGIFSVIKLKSGKIVLLSGDCTYKGILPLLVSPAVAVMAGKSGRVDILQVSHHGGNYHIGYDGALDVPLLNDDGALSISFGLNNRHNHPNQIEMGRHTGMSGQGKNLIAHTIRKPGIPTSFYDDFL